MLLTTRSRKSEIRKNPRGRAVLFFRRRPEFRHTELKREVLWDYARPVIEPDRPPLPGFVREHGYTTGMIGKWHLGLDWPDADGSLSPNVITNAFL